MTLGCKLNFSETSGIATILEDNGYEVHEDECDADLVVINTCTVTELANKKSRQAINKMVQQNPKAKVVAMGCYSQLKPEEVSRLEGVDIVIGSENKFRILEYLSELEKTDKKIISIDQTINGRSFTPTYSSGDRTRSFLKVQDGCDYYCSYCAIPKARGTSRSGNIEQTIKKAEEIVSKGIKEIILTGVNIGDFGKNTEETFFGLLQKLDKVKGLERLRISSIEPNLLTPEIIKYVSESETIMPHFHIPLQCATDNLLRKMRRRYTTSLYRQRVELIRSIMPDACIAADYIVGVPGETSEEFEKSVEFIGKLDISYLHVFTYSERDDTLAVKMEGQVPVNIRKQRSKIVHELSDMKKSVFINKHLGEARSVLFESVNNDNMIGGFTDNYIRVEVPYNENMKNKIEMVSLVLLQNNGNVLGEIK